MPSVGSVSVEFLALPSLSGGDSSSIRSGAQGVSDSGGGGFPLPSLADDPSISRFSVGALGSESSPPGAAL